MDEIVDTVKHKNSDDERDDDFQKSNGNYSAEF